VLYTFAGFVVIPWVVTNQTSSILSKKVGINLQIKKAEFNPYSFELKLGEILLDDIDNKRVATIDNLYINYDLVGLFDKNILINQIQIKNPSIYAKIDKSGKLNLSRIIKPSKTDDTNSSKAKLKRVVDLAPCVRKFKFPVDGKDGFLKDLIKKRQPNVTN